MHACMHVRPKKLEQARRRRTRTLLSSVDVLVVYVFSFRSSVLLLSIISSLCNGVGEYMAVTPMVDTDGWYESRRFLADTRRVQPEPNLICVLQLLHHHCCTITCTDESSQTSQEPTPRRRYYYHHSNLHCSLFLLVTMSSYYTKYRWWLYWVVTMLNN